MIRRLAFWLPVMALAGLMALLLRPNRPPAFTSRVGKAVPAFDLPGLDTAHPGLAASDLRHGTVTVVNLFASWCIPCRVEAPRLKALQARGIVVHGIAVADKPADTQSFLRDIGDPYARIGVDADRKVARALAINGLPETFVIDGHGVIKVHHPGDIRAEDVPALVSAVAEARR